ncbi:MAG TPA: hypothetical protein VJA21_22040 [Verrucomicrobiae bacterium]
MTRHERFLAQLPEIAREYEKQLRPEEWVKSRLRWEDWETLRPEGVAFAEQEIGRRKWRGKHGGVVPEGYDAEAVVNEVIVEMLEGKCRLVMGFTREKVVKELKRLVGQKVRVLQRLKEAKAVRSEWEGEDGNGESRLKDLPAEWEGVDEALWRREEESWRDGVRQRFEEWLKPEPELRAIFRCLSAGVNESKEIARQLGLDEAEVVKGRKKLVRRANEFEKGLKGGKRGGVE